MATWKNLDTLASYSKLAELKGHVNIAAVSYTHLTCVQISDFQIGFNFLLMQFFSNHDQGLLSYMKRSDCNFILRSI